MKALPKRKGNARGAEPYASNLWGASMKALPKRKGNNTVFPDTTNNA